MKVYKHKIVQGLANIIEKYAGHGSSPIMKAVWMGIKGEVPGILETLDNNEEMVNELEKEMGIEQNHKSQL